MTKSQEKGENEITGEAKIESARTGRDICDILKEWFHQAKAANDIDCERRIKRAEKHLACRNKRKRGTKP